MGCWWIRTVQGWSLISEVQKYDDQERGHTNHIHGDSKVKKLTWYLVRKINHHVDWMLVSAYHVSPQSIITQGAQITIRRMHSGQGTEIHSVDSCVASHCIVRLKRYSVTRVKPYSEVWNLTVGFQSHRRLHHSAKIHTEACSCYAGGRVLSPVDRPD